MTWYNDLISPTPGLVLLNKPSGQSSLAALKPLKAQYGGKVGHCGTLDPFATGLLVALCGSFTRLSAYFSAFPKEYLATIRFGETTDTLDSEGSLSDAAPIPSLTALREALAQYYGSYRQYPPHFSARHIQGERAYRRARRGESFVMNPTLVTIYLLTLIYYDPPYAQIMVCCSGGTYLRALARDIAHSCKSVAYIQTLHRTKIGMISSSDAVDSYAVQYPRDLINPHQACRLFSFLSPLVIAPPYEEKIRQGVPFRNDMLIPSQQNCRPRSLSQTAPIYCLFNNRRALIAACRSEPPNYRYIFVVR